jgi:hypothetical protein
MRKFLGVVALIVAGAAILTFTEPGHRVLSAFGMEVTECSEARLLWTLGFHVTQCQCGDCSAPMPPPSPPAH